MAAIAGESWTHQQAMPNGIRIHWVEQGSWPLVMSRSGALTAALNCYRAARLGRPPREEIVQAPMLILWGEHDQALGKELTYGLERPVPNLTIHYLDCGHWIRQERFDQVNRYLTGVPVGRRLTGTRLAPDRQPLGASVPDRSSLRKGVRPGGGARKEGASAEHWRSAARDRARDV